MNVNLTPNITGKNVNIIKGATQADLTNSVNNSKTYRDEAEAFSIVSEAKSVEASYSALNASISSTTASDKATIATTKANEANNSAINASASEAVCIAKATITTDKANIATAQSVIATDKANEASVSANAATTQAGIATTKASEASISASNALTSKNQAETFKNNASASATKASQWADNNYNVEVEAGKYSAKHWSTVAQNATANKVDKVTSTNNAIVRFDGATGAVQNSSATIEDNGNLLLTSGTGGLGYGVGAGGTVTQLTNKLNSVTLNKPTGRITMNNEALPAGATVSFGLVNNLIEISDIVLVAIAGGFSQTQGYQVWCNVGYSGAIDINVKNIHSTTLSESIIIDFKIIKGATS